MRPTPAHRAVLSVIGVSGAGRKELAGNADGEPLRELIAAGLVGVEPPRLGEPHAEAMAREADNIVAQWFLTPAGAAAIGVDPDDVRDRLLRSE